MLKHGGADGIHRSLKKKNTCSGLPLLTLFLFLAQRFPTRTPQNIVMLSAINCGINIQQFLNTSNDSKCTSKGRGNFCPAVGNTWVISVRYRHPLFSFGEFVFKVLRSRTVSSYSSLTGDRRMATPVRPTEQQQRYSSKRNVIDKNWAVIECASCCQLFVPSNTHKARGSWGHERLLWELTYVESSQ